MYRLIFLDIDGVLNSQNKRKELYEKTGKPHSGSSFPFDEKCLNNLKTIIDATDSYIVITSVWRKDRKSIEVLFRELFVYGLDRRVIGYTPILNKSRGEEIKAFLDLMTVPYEYVIIDDDTDMEELKEHLVKTNNETGLTEEDSQKVIKKFLSNS